ncbi:MAG: DUF99 family protein [Nitrososphaerales archaeon]|jgi:endonuclease V-like protein UPF0215 family
MRVHPNKRAIRVLGIAESFRKGDPHSVLAGVVMRSDLVVDGVCLGRATVGGDDATSSIVSMNRRLHRQDVNAIMVSGCIISYYNIVDVDAVAKKTGRPVICLTYRESAGIEDAIRKRFEDPEGKLVRYRALRERTRVVLRTGQTVYARLASISQKDALRVTESFTLQGGVPEPVRLAKLLAHGVRASVQALA